MRISNTHRGVAAVLLALCVGSVGAQAPAATPADGKTRSLGGGGNASGKLLTRDELRACMKRRDALAAHRADIDRERAALDAEREQIGKDNAALKEERDAVNQKTEALTALKPRLEAFKLKTEDWQARNTAFIEANRTDMGAERARTTLEREQTALRKTQQELETERLALTSSAEEAIARFNARATIVDGKATDWNQRNGKLNTLSQTADDDRQAWVSECGNRRYRETDEDAIKRGQ
jgi:hypothetical protein